ncbi:MAG TPA: SgcJ/EcaC family oxidoreductase [Stackebrandtia sp.]|jgi:uncharacterized protein (TIGR02246 family)|uniref:YybH family protein n=1 Tax=Stackebrandtia sp. TaxID=2023065 RepID=UPI002D563A94|nr:SgcJ/EcaC family oxidoreductase [Stackebrandtia sp.]HZE37687.1 SgcJ/EcaC family oxidoreductase [Stackebrandtia sp.]
MSDDEQAIRDVVDTWMSASRDGDTDTVLNLMTDDVLFQTIGNAPFGKEAFANASRGMDDVDIDGSSEIQELQLMGEWAYLRNKLRMTMTMPDGSQVHRSGYTLTILRKGGDGRWRICRDANLVTVDQ